MISTFFCFPIKANFFQKSFVVRLRQLDHEADRQDLQRFQPQTHLGSHAPHHGLH